MNIKIPRMVFVDRQDENNKADALKLE